MTFLLAYVDAILVTRNDNKGSCGSKEQLQKSFTMKGLGALTYLLCLELHRTSDGYVVNENKYTNDLIKLANLSDKKQVDWLLEIDV